MMNQGDQSVPLITDTPTSFKQQPPREASIRDDGNLPNNHTEKTKRDQDRFLDVYIK
jgi:hypothetical protein